MRENAPLETASAGRPAHRLGSALERLGPLSTGAVATSLLLVTVGRLARRLLGTGPSRRLGWSAAAALLTLGLWLLTGPGDADEQLRDRAAESRADEPHDAIR